jgi:ComEC/Rec2-related protein
MAENNGRARVHVKLDSALFVDGSIRKLRGEIVAFARLAPTNALPTAGGNSGAASVTGALTEGTSKIEQDISLPRLQERVALVGELEPLPQRADRGSFWDYLEDQDVRAVMWQIRELRVLAPPSKMAETLTDLRAAFMEYFAPLGERPQALMGALVFGERGGLTRAQKQEFADVGIIHMTAVSGLHVVLFCGVVFWFLSFTGLGRRFTYPLVCLLLFVYAGLCAWTPSVLRAVFTLYVFLLLSYFRARSSSLDVLIMVACILLFFSPSLIGNVGFLLSFAATAGILLFTAPIKQAFDFLRVPRFIGGSCAVTLAADLSISPILAIFFFRISLISPLVNFIYVPFILFIQATGWIVPLLSHLPGGEYAVRFYQILVDFLFESVSDLSSLPWVVAEVPHYSWLVVFGYYALVLLLVKGLEYLSVRRRKNREAALAAQLSGLLSRSQYVHERHGEGLPCAPPNTHEHCRDREVIQGKNAA